MNLKSNKTDLSRRNFVRHTGAMVAGSPFALNILQARPTFSGMNSETLKVGLVGCGGRGTGAANQAMNADPNVVLYAVADVFEDRLESSISNLTKAHGKKINVSEERKFLGFDGYKKLIDSGVDVVLLATPPGFRPEHLTAAVDAGKHVFCEKPVAVDTPGIHKVLAAAQKAKQQGSSLMSGFCWRYHEPKRAIFDKILSGGVGNISTIYNTYNTGTLWSKPKEEDWSQTEYQLRNWLYYNWLSGDHIAEQAVHSLDMMSWAMGGKLPVSAMGTGGRQVRTEDKFGHIFDHFAISYAYEDGPRGFHFSRQQFNCANSYAVEVFGDQGKATIDCIRNIHSIEGTEKWRYKGEQNDMYQTEHDELFAAIRKDVPVNDGEFMAHSTMLAIMGRMAAYTGQEVTWEAAMNSKEKLGPDQISWDMAYEAPAVAKPGITEFS